MNEEEEEEGTHIHVCTCMCVYACNPGIGRALIHACSIWTYMYVCVCTYIQCMCTVCSTQTHILYGNKKALKGENLWRDKSGLVPLLYQERRCCRLPVRERGREGEREGGRERD
jgi:hypothetical protein